MLEDFEQKHQSYLKFNQSEIIPISTGETIWHIFQKPNFLNYLVRINSFYNRKGMILN